MRKLLPFLLPLLLFQGIAFLIYRNGRIDFPKYDHYRLLLHRESVSSDGEWLLFLAHLTRQKGPERPDHYLFRPGLLVILALTDIFFRERLEVTGALGIAWHGLAAFSLFLLASLFVKRSLAILIALLYTAYFPGLELVTWRHISPYLLALANWGGGFWLLLKSPGHPRENFLRLASGGLLLGACLFHESIPASLAVLGLGLCCLRPGNRGNAGEPSLSRRRLLVQVGGVLTIYSACYLATLDYRSLPFLLRSHGAPTVPLPSGARGPSDRNGGPLRGIRLFTGTTTAAFFTAPWMPTEDPTGNPELGLRFLTRGRAADAWSLLFWGGLAALAWRTGRKIRRHGYGREGLLVLAACAALGLQGLLAGERGERNGCGTASHLFNASYNHGLTGYFLCLLLALFLGRLAAAGAAGKRRVLTTVLIALLPCYAGAGALRISRWLRPSRAAKEMFAAVIRESARFLSDHPEYAFAGLLPPSRKTTEPEPLPGDDICWALLQRFADSDFQRRPLFLQRQDGEIWLTAADFVLPPDARWVEMPGFIRQATGPGANPDSRTGYSYRLTRKKIRFLALRLETTFPLTETLRILFDYRHAGRYSRLTLGFGMTDDIMTRALEGCGLDSKGKPERRYHLFPAQAPLSLEIVRLATDFLVFREGRLVMSLPVSEQEGWIAVLSSESRLQPMKLLVMPDEATDAASLSLSPVVRMWPPP